MIRNIETNKKLTPRQVAKDSISWALAIVQNYACEESPSYIDMTEWTDKEMFEFQAQQKKLLLRINKILKLNN